jgi:hypothetical protein
MSLTDGCLFMLDVWKGYWQGGREVLGDKPDQLPRGRHKSHIEFPGFESRTPQLEASRENRVYSPQYKVFVIWGFFNSVFFESWKGKIFWVCLFSPTNAIMSETRYLIRLELPDKITFIQ